MTPEERYPDIEGTCIKLVYNSNMGGNEIHCHGNHIIHIDKTKTIKVGDHVRAVRNSKGFYEKLFVNNLEMNHLL